MIPNSISHQEQLLEESRTPVSERQTSLWDVTNVFNNYSGLLGAHVATALLSFGSVWLVTHNLGADGYGAIIAIVAASSIAQLFVNWSVYSLARFGIEEFVETGQINRSFWVRTALFVPNTAVVAASSIVWLPLLSSWFKFPRSAWIYILCHFLTTSLWLHVQHAIQGAKLPTLVGTLLAVERLLIFVPIATLVILGRLDQQGALLSYIIPPLVMSAVGLFLIRKMVSFRVDIDVVWLRRMLLYAAPLIPYVLVGYFSSGYLDAVFIARFMSAHDLGVYSIATQLNGMVLQMPTLANSLLLPMFVTLVTEAKTVKTFKYFDQVLPSLTLIWGLACTSLSVLLFYAVPQVFGPAFNDSVLPLWILLSATVICLPNALGYAALSHATSKTYISLYASLLAALVNVSLNFTLIPRYGLVGCAIATLVSYIASCTVSALMLKTATDMPTSWILLAVFPSIAGATTFAQWRSPWLGLAVCVSITIFVAYFYRQSITLTVAFVRGLLPKGTLDRF